MAEGKKREWAARPAGSGTFIITKPKRNKVKMRASRIKNNRRAR